MTTSLPRPLQGEQAEPGPVAGTVHAYSTAAPTKTYGDRHPSASRSGTAAENHWFNWLGVTRSPAGSEPPPRTVCWTLPNGTLPPKDAFPSKPRGSVACAAPDAKIKPMAPS